jgi:hypothetical protein
MRFSLSRISARFGTVKKARSWWALVSGWFTLRAMSSASLRTCRSSIDSMTAGMFARGCDIGPDPSIFPLIPGACAGVGAAPSAGQSRGRRRRAAW